MIRNTNSRHFKVVVKVGVKLKGWVPIRILSFQSRFRREAMNELVACLHLELVQS